jgi:hypothetical protein
VCVLLNTPQSLFFYPCNHLVRDFWCSKCSERSSLTDPAFVDRTLVKTAEALAAFNFSGVKLDGCGPSNNLTRWAEVLNATGKAVLIEDCHWGSTVPTGKTPPFGVSPADDGYCAGLQTPSECP